MTDAQFTRQRATAARLIDLYGQTVTISRHAVDPASAQAWNPDELSLEVHTCKLCWYTKGGGLAVALAAIVNTNLAAGTKYALLKGDCGFTPVLGMEISTADAKWHITTVDVIAPSGVPILYLLTVEA